MEGVRLKMKVMVLIIFLTMGAAEVSLAQTERDYGALLSLGVTKLEQNDLRLAMKHFKAALSKAPEGVEAHYYLGVTHARANRVSEAETSFKRALSIDRTFLSAHFDLGVLYYQMREDEKALKTFALVERIDPERARVYFYQGLILRRNGKPKEGEKKLEKALSLDAALGAEIHFLSGASKFQAGKWGLARSDFQGVVTLTPEGELGDSARDFIAKIDTMPKPQKRLSLTASLGLQYDDNVILEPRQGAAAPSGISEKSDFVGIFYFRGKYQWLKKDDWTGDLQYSYFHNFHQDGRLDDFNVQDNHLSTSLDRQFGKYELGLEYEFQVATLAGDSFLLSHRGGPKFKLLHSEKQMTEIVYVIGDKNFKNIATLFPNNSERDVTTNKAGITHYIRFAENGSLYGGYSFEKEEAGNTLKEDDWSFEGNRLKAGIVLPPWWKISTSFEADGIHRQFSHLNQLAPTKKRRDDDILLILSFARPLRAHIELSAQYLYQNNDSNIPAFKYRRSIVGLILTVRN